MIVNSFLKFTSVTIIRIVEMDIQELSQNDFVRIFDNVVEEVWPLLEKCHIIQLIFQTLNRTIDYIIDGKIDDFVHLHFIQEVQNVWISSLFP